MGVVYLAEDPVVGRRVALKVMKASLAADPEARARFLREARSAGAIEHDHIIPIYQAGEDNGVVFIAMPFLQGQSLQSRLQQAAPVPIALVLQVGRETALGLAAAHQQGLLHRDIKPANLWLEDRGQKSEVEDQNEGRPTSDFRLLTSDLRVKILDFGLARPVADDGLTLPGAVLGTPGYMSPEQINGEELDGRSDLFSLGCVLYRMTTGEAAFTGKSLTGVMRATAEAEPTPPRERNPRVPPALSELIMRLLSKKPADRPASAREAAAALAEIERSWAADGASTDRTTVEGTTTVAMTRAARKTSRWLAPVVAAFAVLLAALGVVWILNRDEGSVAAPSHEQDPGPLQADLDLRVWKKNDTTRMLTPADAEAMPLRTGDYVQITARSNRPAYFYIVQMESSGEAVPLFPWIEYDWKRRRPEEMRESLQLPDDPVKNAAPLSASPTGMEAIFLLARGTSLGADEQAHLQKLLAGFPASKSALLPRGAIWLSRKEAPRLSRAEDRGRLNLDPAQAKQLNDPLDRVRTLLEVELPRLFSESRAICYAFEGP
jgi:serine/threonine protein kinase